MRLGLGLGLGLAGGVAFTPAKLTTAIAWFDATSGTSSTVDGTALTTWTDRINGYVGTAVGGTKPSYKAVAQNGLPGIHYPEVDGSGFTTVVPGSADYTIYIAHKPRIASIAAHTQWLASDAGGARGLNYSAAAHLGAYNGSFPDSATLAVDATGFIFGLIQTSGLSVELRVNGVSKLTAAASARTPGNMCLGGAGGQTVYLTGETLDVVICSSPLAGADLVNLEKYLHDKWGI